MKAACERLIRLTDSNALSGNARILKNLNHVSHELSEIRSNPFFNNHLRGLPYSSDHFNGTYEQFISESIDEIDLFLDKNRDVLKIDLGEILQIVPQQEFSPIQFELLDGRLTVKSIATEESIEDKKLIAPARSMLVEQGEDLLGELEMSNCDRRFLDHMRFVQTKLESSYNIVQLGLTSQSANIVLVKYEDELSPVTSAKAHAYLLGISQYSAQFPEWRRFCEQAAAPELDQRDAVLTRDVVTQLLKELSNNPESIDPEVPKSFKFLIESIRDPKQMTKRIVYGIAKTIENFAATIFLSVVEYVKSIHQGLNTGIKRAVSGIVAVSLVAVAIQCARALGPTASKIPGLTWMDRAAEVMSENLPSLMKSD